MIATLTGVSHHAQTRALERLGRYLTAEEWRNIISDIVNRRAMLLSRQEDMAEMYLVRVGTITATVIWHPMNGVISTVMPEGSRPINRRFDA